MAYNLTNTRKIASEEGMNIGILHERRNQEHRVALTPAGVFHLVKYGYQVYLESGAGQDSGWSDEQYVKAGAQLVFSAQELYGRSNLVMKVSPLELEDLPYIQEGQSIFSWQHLVMRDSKIIKTIIEKELTVIGYEIIEDLFGNRPIVTYVAEIAGYMAVITSLHYLQNETGGRAKMIAGIPGVPQGSITVLGAGLTGAAAVRAATGIGAYVVVIDKDLEKMRRLDDKYHGRISTFYANHTNIAKAVGFSDVLIGAVASHGDLAPRVVSQEMVQSMKYRAVIADLSIDQGGCVETSRPTTLADPVFVEHDVVHYCVPNMTANVSRTTSNALSNSMMRYLEAIKDLGLDKALITIPCLKNGAFFFKGRCVKEYIARRFDLIFEPLKSE
ncbi:MAG TPA: alanine dehydrogenase [Candidatus Marinimicrobia bacterium]|nr:alanine dehydrogenase [Candidatus Neomarinimicrobiota bacterium]